MTIGFGIIEIIRGFVWNNFDSMMELKIIIRMGLGENEQREMGDRWSVADKERRKIEQ